MKRVIKSSKFIGLVILMGVLFTTINVNAQTPDDDPGIGGPGSGGSTPGDDGGPVVPLDRDLSIALIAVGIAYGYKKLKENSLLSIN
jgi:hypothetical protein